MARLRSYGSTFVLCVVAADRCQEGFSEDRSASSSKLRTVWRTVVRSRGHNEPRGCLSNRKLSPPCHYHKSQDSAVGIATGYGLDDQGVRVRVPRGGKNFHFSLSSRPALGPTQPPIQWVPGPLSPGVKWPGREANNSAPTSAEVKKTWVYTSTPPYVFTRTTLPLPQSRELQVWHFLTCFLLARWVSLELMSSQRA
jgi:hypothetical protein